MENTDFQEPQLHDYIRVLIRRRKAVYICFLAILLAVTIISLSMYPTYNSRTTVQLEDEKNTGITFTQSPFEEYVKGHERIKSQIEIMKSRTLSERVAKRLNLQFLVEPEKRMYHLFLEKLLFDQQKKETPDNLADIRIKPISVKTNAKQEEYKILFQNGKSFILRNEDDKEVGKGEIGKPFECDSLSFIIEGLSQEEKSLRFRLVSLSAAGKKILESLNISPLKDTNIIKIEVNWNDATIAKEIAEAILEEYKQFSIDKRTREASQVLSFIESELGRQKNELLQVEAKLEKYKKEKGIIALDVNAQNALTQMAQYEREYRAIENYRKQAEIVLAELQKADPFTEKEALLSLGAGLNNPLLIDLGKELGKLNAEKSALNSVLKKEHPKIRQADREIQSVKRSIISELRSLISTIKTSEETSKASLTKYEKMLDSLPAAEKDLFEIMRAVKVRQDLSAYLLQKRGELSVNKASELGNMWVVDPPVIQPGPIKPNLQLNFLLSLIGGIVLSVFMAFFAEYIDTTVKTPEELQRIADLPYLGAVLHFKPDEKGTAGDLKMLDEPPSDIAENFRTIRTNLLFTTLGETKKILAVCSTGIGEGKTFITINLAAALAQSGKRVLLVDSDLRKSRLWRILKTERSPGLTDILVNQEINLSTMPIKKTPVENLEFIPPGSHSPNPSELLGSEKMEEFLSLVRDKYDYILLDCAPLLLATDASVLARKADGVIFTVRKGKAEREMLREALERLTKLQVRIMGMVFNDLTRDGTRNYYKYSYYNYYSEEGAPRKKVSSRKSRSLPPGNKTE